VCNEIPRQPYFPPAPSASHGNGGEPIGRAFFVMVTNPSVPAKTGLDFIAYAKASPGKINMASSGPGSATQLFAELFKVMAGVDLVTVNYRGVGPALPDLISGRVKVMFAPVAGAIGYIRLWLHQAIRNRQAAALRCANGYGPW
jgi:tripartite tricarboxylate transporter family receptor